MTDPNRAATEGFAAALGTVGLAVEATPAEADGGELGDVHGTIYRIWWPRDSGLLTRAPN